MAKAGKLASYTYFKLFSYLWRTFARLPSLSAPSLNMECGRIMSCERDRFLSFSSFLMDILMSPALLPLPASLLVSSPSEKVPLYGGINAACERGLDDAAVPVFRGQWRTEFNEGHSQVYNPLMCLERERGDIFEFLPYPIERRRMHNPNGPWIISPLSTPSATPFVRVLSSGVPSPSAAWMKFRSFATES